MTSEIDPSDFEGVIGNTNSFDVGCVTRQEVRRYARAVEDENPLFFDVDYAREQGYDDLVVPPNYFPALIEHGPGAPGDTLREDGLDPSSYPIDVPPEAIMMGGGQDLMFDRYVTAGERVRAEETLTDLYQRESGRIGILTFIERDMEYFDEDDERVIGCHETVIMGDRQ